MQLMEAEREAHAVILGAGGLGAGGLGAGGLGAGGLGAGGENQAS